jgi:amino acid transporter
VNRAYGNRLFSFLVAFAVMASGVTSAAALSSAFGGDYLSEFIDVDTVVGGLCLLAAIAVVNLRGISESVKLNVGFTLVELGGLVLIVVIAAVALGQGDADAGRAFEFKEGSSIFAATLAGAALAFYALIGFEDSVNVAEEAEDPRRNYPRVLFLGLAIAGGIYLLVTIGAAAVVPVGDLASSDGPLLEVVKQGPLGIDTKLFSAIGLLALSNGALINLIMASRLLYGMSKEDVLPAPFGRVLPERRTPWVAILFVTALAAALVITGNLEKLADTTVALLVIVFAIVNATVLVLRREEVEHDHFRVPWPLPVIGVCISIALLTQVSGEAFARGGILIALGLALWAVNWLVLRHSETGHH